MPPSRPPPRPAPQSQSSPRCFPIADNIVSFARDPISGRLYDQVTRTDPALSNGQAIAIATDGRAVWAVAEGANTLVSWDRTSNGFNPTLGHIAMSALTP